MSAKILLRMAAGLMLMHLIGHTFGQMGWKESTKPVQTVAIQQITGPKFLFMGVYRSMGNYFDGYGYSVSISILVTVLILWFVAACTTLLASSFALIASYLLVTLPQE